MAFDYFQPISLFDQSQLTLVGQVHCTFTIREYLIQGTYKPFSTWPVESPDSGLCTPIRQKGLH